MALHAGMVVQARLAWGHEVVLSQTQNLSQFCALCRELGSGGMFIVLEALEAVFNFDVCGVTKCVSFMRR